MIRLNKLIGVLCTAAIALSSLSYTNIIKADSELYLHGDLNFDSSVNIADVILLKNRITEPENETISDGIADLNEDGILNAADLAVMYEYCMGITDRLPYEYFKYETIPDVSPLIPSSVSDADSSSPSVGSARALVLFAEFSDVKFSSSCASQEELQEELFGKGSSDMPYDSISSYLERSSYGNYKVDGDVIFYNVNKPFSSYMTDDGYERLVMDVIDGLGKDVDCRDYDENNDGIIDILSVTVPLDNATDEQKTFWYGATSTWYRHYYYRPDGMEIIKYIVNDEMPNHGILDIYKRTFLHELGHSMGLPDFYKYASSDWEGLKGTAGYCRMDDSLGDYCSFSKLMLGWLREDEVQIFDVSSGTQTFELKDSSYTGSCILLPAGKYDGSFTSEYFLIEYVTTAVNNADVIDYAGWWNKDRLSGIRIFHIDAEMYTDYWGRKDFMYDNYSEKYRGDDKERVIRLVNDQKKGFYVTGDIIDSSVSGFHAYDSSGYETADTGYTVRIGELSDGTCKITVDRK